MQVQLLSPPLMSRVITATTDKAVENQLVWNSIGNTHGEMQ
jgi:hypothetical protein